MTVEWTHHRFISGALALDVANSVILRFDSSKRRDRFADPEEISRFAIAAEQLSGERQTFGCLDVMSNARVPMFLELREAIDRYFRHSLENRASRSDLADLLELIAHTLRNSEPDKTQSLDAATAYSALRLISAPEKDRLKICAHCQWLFLDKSKNRSRIWCDMTVCGNRVKARLHYRKTRQETGK